MENNNKSTLRWLWSAVMALVYLAVAVSLVFTSFFDNFDIAVRIALGVLFFLYGLFRAYRAWKTL